MTENEERAWTDGCRATAAQMLRHCLELLGYKGDSDSVYRCFLERESAIATLRRVCLDHGDMDWTPDLHLSDIIEKHLEDHLNGETSARSS